MPKVETRTFARILPIGHDAVNQDVNAIIEQLLNGVNIFPANRERIQNYIYGWEALEDGNKQTAGNVETLLQWEMLLQLLTRSGNLQFATSKEPLIKLVPFSYNFNFHFPPIEENNLYKLSRFAYLHVDNDDLVIQSPKGFAKIILLKSDAITIIYRLSKGVTIGALLENRNLEQLEVNTFLQLLLLVSIIEPCAENGVMEENVDDVFRQWDFHDLLFHSQSRLGRNETGIGATYRFKNKIKPPPAVKQRTFKSKFISLPKPDMRSLMINDLPLTAAIETRRSIRTHDVIPISIEQLGHFLFRVGRVSNQFETEVGEFTRRPYPNGGASYELEFYLTVDRCVGLERGFYYYDAVNHGLYIISDPCPDMEMLLEQAWISSAMTCHPQILFSISSRFQRVSWKYKGMAYATQLKNAGALYAMMYLAATSMGLAACGLGLGDADRFSRIAGTNYYEEGSIAEFMLGSALPGA